MDDHDPICEDCGDPIPDGEARLRFLPSPITSRAGMRALDPLMTLENPTSDPLCSELGELREYQPVRRSFGSRPSADQ
jgi:hypothetical protein